MYTRHNDLPKLLKKEGCIMNKQDIAGIRKEFKMDNTMLKIKEIYSVYLKKDGLDTIFSEFNYFERMEDDKQDFYIKNFRKILSGSLDSKLFELDFENIPQDMESSEGAYRLLYETLNTSLKNEFTEGCNRVVARIAQNYKYDTDVVITFIKAQYFKGSKKRSEEAEEAKDDNTFAFEFMMCSVNKIEPQKKALKFDYEGRQFVPSSSLELVINLNAPLDGFMYPCFTSNASDVNRIMYYSSKLDTINSSFVMNVLECKIGKTAKEEKEDFNVVLKNAVGDKITPENIQTIYEKLSDKLNDENDEGETPVISRVNVKEAIIESGIEPKREIEEVYEETLGDKNYDFKLSNIVPNLNAKSIKIGSENLKIILNPKNLRSIKQVRNSSGNKCLLIELNEEVEIEGLSLKTEDKW